MSPAPPRGKKNKQERRKHGSGQKLPPSQRHEQPEQTLWNVTKKEMLITWGSPAEAAVETMSVDEVTSQNIMFLILQVLSLLREAQRSLSDDPPVRASPPVCGRLPTFQECSSSFFFKLDICSDLLDYQNIVTFVGRELEEMLFPGFEDKEKCRRRTSELSKTETMSRSDAHLWRHKYPFTSSYIWQCIHIFATSRVRLTALDTC